MNTALILDFLRQLEQNNSKAWMDLHKPAYQAARAVLLDIIQQLIDALRSMDVDLGPLTAQDCIFRINRDIRFTKDKSPYKTNMGAYVAKGGRNGTYAGYYLHLKPDNQSFIAGGLYQPVPAQLKTIRQEIDYHGELLQEIVAAPSFQKHFGSLQGSQLQRPPQGYSHQHPYINWLRLQSFAALHALSDRCILQDDFVSRTAELFKILMPLNHFLNTALGDDAP